MPLKRNNISPVPDVVVRSTTPIGEKLQSRKRESVVSSADITNVILSSVNRKLVKRGYAKILLLFALPLVTIVTLSCVTVTRTVQIVQTAEETSRAVDINSAATEFVASLQVERGLSTLFLGSTNTSSLELHKIKLRESRESTDNKLISLVGRKDFKLPPTVVGNETIRNAHDLISRIEHHRSSVDELKVSPEDNIHFYTNITVGIIQFGLEITTTLNGGRLWPLFVSRDLLLDATDLLGIARALGAHYFASCGLNSVNFEWFTRVTAQGEQLLVVAFSYYEKAAKTYQEKLIEKSFDLDVLSEKQSEILRNDKVCTGTTPGGNNNDAVIFFDNMSKKIESIIFTRKELASDIVSNVTQDSNRAKWNTAICVAGLFITIVLCLCSGAWYAHYSFGNLNRIADFAKQLSDKTSELKKQKKRAQLLLLQILPEPVCDRLQRGLGVPAEQYDFVSIYFSDIVGFTTLSANKTPMEIIELLNALYSLFDHCIDLYNVYKVETIGDAYMVVSGLPVRHVNHAAEIGCMAVDLLSQVQKFEPPHLHDQTLALRIGINTGPCVAGVVGIKMPRYCLFGDTVNTASRMESTGLAFKIHISEATKEAIENCGNAVSHVMVPRGVVNVKGKGTMQTYWLEDCKMNITSRPCAPSQVPAVSWFDMEMQQNSSTPPSIIEIESAKASSCQSISPAVQPNYRQDCNPSIEIAGVM